MSQSILVSIASAAPEDEAALGRLGAMLVAVHHEFDPERFISTGPNTAGAYGAFLVSQLSKPNALILVAKAADVVVGYAYAGVEGTDWMALRGPAGVVYDLVVEPDRRREGIGRQLLQAARAKLVERGAPRVVLSTAERNLPAQGLFSGLGFRRTMIEMTWEPPSGR